MPARRRSTIGSVVERRTALLYARVSSKEQDREGFSIPAQLRLLREYAVAGGIGVGREFIDVETAKQAGRTGFSAMVDCLRRAREPGRVILVEKTDRLYRNLKDWVTLDELDLEIHFVKEGVVLSRESRSSEKFIHGIKVLMAKNYIDNLSEEVRKGMLEKAAEGIWPTRAPLGYVNTEGEDGKRVIQVDPLTAPMVTEIFEWYGSGRYSLQEVTRMAAHAGLRYRSSGAKVPRSTVHAILRNPVYHGDVVWDGRIFRGVHVPIVSRQLWNEVQAVLSGRPGKHRLSRRDFAFAGLLTCGHCGCSLSGQIKKGRYVYYHCTGFRGHCGEPYVREETLEKKFTELLGGLHIDADILEWLTDALRSSHRDERHFHEAAIARLHGEYSALQRRLDAMYVDKLDGGIDAATFDRLSGEWRAEQGRLLDTLHQHQNANVAYFAEGAQLLELASRSQELFAKQEPSEKRKLLDCVLSNCSWKGGELTPAFRQPFDLIWGANVPAHVGPRKSTVGVVSSGRFDTWLPEQDSNLQPSG
jgi:site-specific DNA recombinase